MSARPQRPTGDEGFSLVELMVAMIVTGMVLAIVGTFFVNISRITAASKTGREAMAQCSLAVNEARAVVSMASDNPTSASATTPAIVAGSDTSVTVISYSSTSVTSPAPSQVVLALDSSGYLVETRTPGVLASTGYWTFTGASSSKRIAGPFLTSGGTAFFSYIAADGSLLDSSGTTGLATADRASVAFVRVTATAYSRNGAGTDDPVVVTGSIGMTNVNRDVDATTALPTLTGGR